MTKKKINMLNFIFNKLKKYKYKKQLKFWKQILYWMRQYNIDALELKLEFEILEGDGYMIPNLEFHYIKILNNDTMQELVDSWKRPLIFLDEYFLYFNKNNNIYLIKVADVERVVNTIEMIQ